MWREVIVHQFRRRGGRLLIVRELYFYFNGKIKEGCKKADDNQFTSQNSTDFSAETRSNGGKFRSIRGGGRGCSCPGEGEVASVVMWRW